MAGLPFEIPEYEDRMRRAPGGSLGSGGQFYSSDPLAGVTADVV